MSRPPKFPISVDHSMEVLPVTSRIRQVYPEDIFPNGSYAPLLYGRVRYWIIGPEDGPKVVLIHGISTPSVSWTEIAPYLAEHGFRVLIYDLYGKGYSEAPKVPCDATLFSSQLALLMQYVRWDAAHIVGFSMGGGVNGAFTSSLPHLVAGKTVFLASAGLVERPPSNTNRPILSQFQELRELQGTELPGYRRSFQSCIQEGPIRGLENAFDKLANLTVGPEAKDLQVLIIHGTDDAIVPYGEAHKIKARVPQAEIVTVEGAGHDLVLREEHWKIVADAIVSFLK